MLFPVADAHTHALVHNAVVNRFPFDPMPPGYIYSVGIHPWHAAEATPEQWQWLADAALRPDVVAIGEAGLDKLCSTPLPVQTDAFIRQVRLSESVGKPLIIHNARANQEILDLHTRLRPTQPWVLHGFRGKPELAQMFLRRGFHISLPPRHNPATAAIIPPSRLLHESDTPPESESRSR